VKLPLLKSIVPPHVFCLLDEGVTYARVRRDEPPGFEESRHFRYPAGSTRAGSSGAPLLSRESLAEAVKAAKALSGGRLKAASATYPDSWARILPIEMESVPGPDDAGREMVLWKLKKLLPGSTADVVLVYHPMTAVADERRVLVAATPREAVDAVERSFDELGVRIGYLAPASLALLEGLAPVLSAAAQGDYALLHRDGGVLSFFIARGTSPLFFRQRPADADSDDQEHEREARLSLSYYAERLKGPGLAAVYFHDDRQGSPLGGLSAFPVSPAPLSGRLVSADPDFDQRVAARPELFAGFAAVYGK
jgi:hypothetical protein